MSGGRFDYLQNKIYNAADELDTYIKNISIGRSGCKPETMNKLMECVNTLNRMFDIDVYIERS